MCSFSHQQQRFSHQQRVPWFFTLFVAKIILTGLSQSFTALSSLWAALNFLRATRHCVTKMWLVLLTEFFADNVWSASITGLKSTLINYTLSALLFNMFIQWSRNRIAVCGFSCKGVMRSHILWQRCQCVQFWHGHHFLPTLHFALEANIKTRSFWWKLVGNSKI